MAEGEQSTTKSAAPHTNPPIIMKVDAPPDDNVNRGQEEQENGSSKDVGDFKMCSPSLRPSGVNTNPFATTQNKPLSRGILKPPQLSLNSNNSFTLQPSKLNPFANKTSTESTDKTPFALNPSRLSPLVGEALKSPAPKQDQTENKQVVQNGETPKFVPLLHTDKPNSVVTSSSNTNMPCSSLTSNNTFVFGQNLQDRVIAESKPDEPKASTSLNSNGTSEMLFSSAIKHEVKSDSVPTANQKTKSLSESAREYEESRAVKRKYEEVEVKTGEEEETNILSLSCKLFAFDKASGSWQERGRGILRLNDFEIDNHVQSRLVFRTSGSLRVILNTKIWAEMTIEKASDKSIRLTALDANGDIRVFLIMASIEDSRHLFTQLQSRLDKEIALQKRKKTSQESKNSD